MKKIKFDAKKASDKCGTVSLLAAGVALVGAGCCWVFSALAPKTTPTVLKVI